MDGIADQAEEGDFEGIGEDDAGTGRGGGGGGTGTEEADGLGDDWLED